MHVESSGPGRVCPHCATVVAADAPGQLCARCLLNAAATETEAGAPTGRHAPPSLPEVAAAFPGFEVIGLIGVGGMGFVYRVRSHDDGRESALKLLPASLAAQPAFVERFEREARTLARLHHPNIVAVHGWGRSGGFCYLLMEFVEGANLRQAMRSARFNPAETLALVPQLCDALQYAHSQGILHRDIKPENILLDARGVPKIADFGIAKLVGDLASPAAFTLTQTGQRVGTPHYMAPEQIERPESVDHRADIYSLGVVLYELLTGELPLGRFPAPSLKAAMDERIDEIVFRALSKERELRQQTAGQVRHEVESLESTPAVRKATSPSRSVACYLSSPSHLRSVWGSINIYSDRGRLRLEADRLVFVSSDQTRVMLLSRITGLSVGEFPRLMKPTGLAYIGVRHVSEDQEHTIFLTPHPSRWAPTWDTNVVVREWEQLLREAIAAAGLPEVPTLPPSRPDGVRWDFLRVGMIVGVPGLAALVTFFVGLYNNNPFLVVASALAGGFSAAMGFAVWMARSKNPSGAATSARGTWVFILLGVGAPLSLALFVLATRLTRLRSPSPPPPAPSAIADPGQANAFESRSTWAYSPPPTISANRGRHAARAADAVQALANLFPLIQAASNRVGCLPPSLRTFGLAAAHPSSHRPFVYLGGNPKRQSPVLAFTQATPDSGPQDVLLVDGSVQPMSSSELALYLQTEFLWVQNQVRKLEAVGPLDVSLEGSLSAWATQGVPLPPGMLLSPAAASALQGWGVTVVMDVSSPQQSRVAHGSLAEVFWTATDEVSRNGKPALALEALQPFLTFLAAPGTVPVRFEFMLAGHAHRVSREGLAAVAIVLAAHADDPARLQLGQQLLDRFIAPDVDGIRSVTLFERFKPGEERTQTDAVQVSLGSLRTALPSHFLIPQRVRKGPENPEGGPPESVPVPWLPRR